MNPQKFVKQPVTVEAMRWDGSVDGAHPIIEWILGHAGNARCLLPGAWDHMESAYIQIATPEGRVLVFPGDYVIRGVAGEFYPCKPDIFRRTYIAADETESWVEYAPGIRATDFEPEFHTLSGGASRGRREVEETLAVLEATSRTEGRTGMEYGLMYRLVTGFPWAEEATDE